MHTVYQIHVCISCISSISCTYTVLHTVYQLHVQLQMGRDLLFSIKTAINLSHSPIVVPSFQKNMFNKIFNGGINNVSCNEDGEGLNYNYSHFETSFVQAVQEKKKIGLATS